MVNRWKRIIISLASFSNYCNDNCNDINHLSRRNPTDDDINFGISFLLYHLCEFCRRGCHPIRLFAVRMTEYYCVTNSAGVISFNNYTKIVYHNYDGRVQQRIPFNKYLHYINSYIYSHPGHSYWLTHPHRLKNDLGDLRI